MEQHPLEGLRENAIRSLQRTLAHLSPGIEHPEIPYLGEAMTRHDQQATLIFSGVIMQRLNLPGEAAPLERRIYELAALLASHDFENPTANTGHQLDDFAKTLASVGILDMAYNFFEFAYLLKKICGEPALETADNLCIYANIENHDQYAFSLWRFAIERVAESIRQSDQWIEAMDAVEIALLHQSSRPEAHDGLFEELQLLLADAQQTPLAPLLLALFTLGNPSMSEEQKKDLLMITAELSTRPKTESEWIGAKLLAMINSQYAVEEKRYHFLQRHGRPAINFHDLSLFHENLEDILPIRQSLIIEHTRTNRFYLDLVHEVTHAISLVGTLGKVRTTLRIGVHLCEYFISGKTEMKPNETVEPLKTIPFNILMEAFGSIQLHLGYKAAVIEATWKPWLEGIAMYFEMLGDPSHDPSEISPIYSSIRSLVDFDFQAQEGETEEDFQRRLREKVIQPFEQFCSSAVSGLSYFRHIGYVYNASEDPTGDIYVLGYMLVRSVVAKWELQLGRKLDPIYAGKLLLQITRGDANTQMVPPLDVDVAQFQSESADYFKSWLTSITSLDKSFLENYMTPRPEKDRAWRNFYWKEGRMLRNEENPAEADALMVHSISSITAQVLNVLHGTETITSVFDPSQRQAWNSVHASIVDEFDNYLDHYWNMMTLLPIGKANIKVNFLDDNIGSVLLHLRTYPGSMNEAEPGYFHGQKYSVHQIALPGGKNEADELKKLLKEKRNARVFATRIIDLTGRADMDGYEAHFSYLCLFVAKKWHWVSLGQPGKVLEEKDTDFITQLKQRIFPGLSFGPNDPISSYDYLSKRYDLSFPEGPVRSAPIQEIDPLHLSLDIALDSCERAFGVKRDALENAMKETRRTRPRAKQLSLWLHATGMDIPFDPTGMFDEKENSFLRMTCSTNTFSGIKPFNN